MYLIKIVFTKKGGKLEKNKRYDFEIIDSGMNFEGIAKDHGKTIFIPGAIISEKVNAKIIKDTSSYSIGKIEKVIKKSKYRIEPICSSFSKCGGCSNLHIDYDFQLLLKNKIVENCLRKQNISYEKLNTTLGMGMPYFYRNKVQYPIKNVDGKNKIGFYSMRTHDIVENECCFIQNRVIDMLAKNIFDEMNNLYFKGYNENEKTGDIKHLLIRRGYHTGKIMVVIIVSSEELLKDKRFDKLVKNIVSKNESIESVFLNVNDRDTNEILGGITKRVYGNDYIMDIIGNYKYYISPKSFFQVNTLQAELLYSTLKEELELTGNEVIFDLYSGVGAIGIFLSDNVKRVFSIEIEKEAVDMANLNISKNNIKNAEYIAGSVEEKIDEFRKRNIKPDIIVIDPPRKGLDEKSIEYIIKFNPSKIGYISCNPATMARDLKMLEQKYIVKSVTPVDMFPHTSHVECCSVLHQKDSIQ